MNWKIYEDWTRLKIIVLSVALTIAVLIAGLRPYVSASLDDFGLAVGWRASTHQRYQSLVIWER